MSTQSFPQGHPSEPADAVAAGPALRVLNLLLRYRVVIVLTAAVVALGASVPRLFSARTYTSNASFAPVKRGRPSNLSGLAAQFGVNIATNDADQNPQFYVDLLRSRQILGDIVEAKYRFKDASGKQIESTLLDYLEIPASTPAARREWGVKALNGQLAVGSSVKTGVISVSATLESPELAAAVLKRLIDRVNEYNLASRQQQAGAERRFTEERLDQVRQDLRRAENELQAFIMRNASLGPPDLQFQRDRLSREVTMRQQVYTSLMQAHEQAKIDEVRDTPALMLVEAPYVPVNPDGRGTIRRGLLGLLLGSLIGILLALLSDFGRRSRSVTPEQFDEFVRLRRELLHDLRNPLRPLGRVFSRSNGR